MSVRATLAAIGVGLVGGLLSGLLGVGGGIVMVPGLVLIVGLSQRPAHATSLAAIIPIGVVGGALYALDGGHVDAALAVALAAGAVIGAPLGARALALIDEDLLRWLFVAVAVIAGVRLLAE